MTGNPVICLLLLGARTNVDSTHCFGTHLDCCSIEVRVAVEDCKIVGAFLKNPRPARALDRRQSRQLAKELKARPCMVGIARTTAVEGCLCTQKRLEKSS